MLKFCFSFWIICCSFFSCNSKQEQSLKVAVAANVLPALKELAIEFAHQTHIEIDLIPGSSGKLYAQITQGAPFDIFVSADMEYPQKLFEKHYCVEKPLKYAEGKLVLWTSQVGRKLTMASLNDSDINHIAIANPKIAPYGKAAVEVLNHFNLYTNLHNKLVYGENVGQTNQLIISGAAQIGLTAISTILSLNEENRGAWTEIPKESYSAIVQGVVYLKNNREVDSKAFLQYLISEEAKRIWINHGYNVN